MENNEGSKSAALSPQEETAKAAILAECDKFAKAGITFVAAHFDGYGDSGTTEVRCYDSESYAWGEDETVAALRIISCRVCSPLRTFCS